MDLGKKVNIESAGEEITEAAAQKETAEAEVIPAEQPAAEDNYDEDELPVLVPDDYDVEDIDYSVRNTMSDVVAAKGGIEQAERYKRPKLKGKEAWDNFWYHHKTGVLVAVVSVVMLVIIIIQSIPTKYDYHFNIYSNASLGIISLSEIEEQLMEYAEDVDGNEEILINIASYNRNGNTDPYESIAAYMFIEMEFGGEFNSFLVALDKDHYNFIVANVGEETFEAYEGYPVLIPLRDSDFITSAAEGSETELYLALVSVPERFLDNEEMVARHDAAKALLGRILADHPELAKADSTEVSAADAPAA